uniref:Integrin subunit alpha D n=1 Tax=Bos mutus grunniens TaxID=30521 RepID=A0A8B9YCR5_BOSMU
MYCLASYHGFNLDVEEPLVFREDGAGFGQALVVGAPLEVVTVNKTGRLYDCTPATRRCRPISLNTPSEAVDMSLGLSLAASTHLSQLLACGPTVHKACGENMYLKGTCLLLSSHLQIIRTVPAALPECTNQEIDIAFLIDGSGSIDQTDFTRMKNFVRAVMDRSKGTNTQFSLMQYSNLMKTHFTFNQFWTSRSSQSLVDPIAQLNGLTFTATGIRRVVNRLFLSLGKWSNEDKFTTCRVTPAFFLDRRELFHSKNGARKSARKIIIVITDGEKYKDPLEYKDVIPEAEKANIIRYAIGVGDAFQAHAAREELKIIGSMPSKDHVFKVDSFAALSSIQKQLQEKIFAVEGKWGNRLSSSHLLTLESFLFSQDGPVLGAVGSFSWSGGAFLYPQIRTPPSLTCYSTELALWRGAQSLILGAPRHQHTGKVVLFTQVSRQWRPQAEVTGTQIGSYFGASLCSVDVNGDSSSDLVLIGAPHFYEQTQGGQVSVCPFPRGVSTWPPLEPLWGSPDSAGDVNGDRLADVAIGAPGEQENQGAVYLFHGTSELGIGPTHSQRIAGSQLSLGLQYFGRSLSGGQDLTQDGLVDLAVGAQGHALLLRSLPVLKVNVTMKFTPPEVTKAVYQCWDELTTTMEAGQATVCLTIHKSSQDRLGDIRSSVTYDLALDPGRLISRAVFGETRNWTLTRRKTLELGEHCDSMKLLIPDCVEDMVNPIILRLNFSLVGEPIASSQNLRPVLAVGSQDLFTASLPFEKNCGQDHLCEGDLSVNLSFLGLETLVVGSSLELNVAVMVSNEGEDSYGTVISFYYPAGLSYRRTLAIQQPGQRPLRLACEAVPTGNEGLKSSGCSINHPIFREGIKGTFIITFDVSYKATLGDKFHLSANISSENNKPTSNKTTSQLELPVKYAVYTVISRQEESTKYFNFSASDQKSRREAEHRYRVNNLSQRELAISVHFWVPILLNGVVVWDVALVAPSQVLPCVSEREPPQQPDFQTQMPSSLVLDCSIADCLRFRCDIPSFGVQEELDFILKGNLSFGWASQLLQKKTLVVSMAEVTFNRSVYTQISGQEAFLRAQVEMVLEEYEVYSPMSLLVSSSMGGLLLLALITALLYKVSVFIPLLRPPASGPALPQTGSYRGKNSGNGVRLV